MNALVGCLALMLPFQVPSPDLDARASSALLKEHQAILETEASTLSALAGKLTAAGQVESAASVLALVRPPSARGGAIRFDPLPEVVEASNAGLASVPASTAAAKARLAPAESTRAEAARSLFELANRALGSRPRHLALADSCLRAVIERQPDHAEARRLLGFEPHEGGWATPYAISQLTAGKTAHPVYGWVNSTWIPHLEKGELPARGSAAGRERWLPASEADAQRNRFAAGWEIRAEHFFIKTNVPLSEAIGFGKRLEALHELFQSLCADVIGESLPLARRFRDPKASGEFASTPHEVWYFADRDDYVAQLRPSQGASIAESLGIYLPPARGRKRGRAYFFRDEGGQIDALATLHHEVSHQLLFESGVAGPNDFRRNVGDYWVFEGLGTFFETLSPRPGGGLSVGGVVGPRLLAATRTFEREGSLTPLDAFVRYNQQAFNGGDIFKHYQEATALATFLMCGEGGAYREPFLEYVRDACQGTLRVTSGKALDDRLGLSYSDLESKLWAYLRASAPAAEPR